MRYELHFDIEENHLPKATQQAIVEKRKEVRQAKREHDERIRPLLTPPLRRLLDISPTELDDAQLRSLTIDSTQRTIDLRLFCGYDQVGYYYLYLRYKDVQLSDPLINVLCFLAHHQNTEMVRQEIEIEHSEPPVFIHRIEWRTNVITRRVVHEGYYTLNPETEVRFSNITIKRVATRANWNAKRNVRVIVIHETDETRIAKYLSLTPPI